MLMNMMNSVNPENGGINMAVNILENKFINSTADYNFQFVLNKNAGEKITDKEGLILQLQHLSIHGINTPLTQNKESIKSLRYRVIYLIPVFQQKTLGYYKQTTGNNGNWLNSSLVNGKKRKVYIKKIVSFKTKREERRVTSHAIRAAYALNLDYALVKIGVTEEFKPWVLFVNPFPEGNDEINSLFEQAMRDFDDKWEDIMDSDTKDAIFGADPEFVLQSPGGDMVLASKYLPKNGIAGCDRIWVNRDRSQLPLAELRPSPSSDIREFIINLYKSMLFASKKIKNQSIKWMAGAMPIKGYPIGGHLHFSNVQLNSFLLRALDNYLTLVVTLFEDKKGIKRRPKYGFLGDYREKFHGGFEYRTLPSWLVSPILTKGVIALAKIIVENYTYLTQNPLQDINFQKAYYNGDKEVLKPVVLGLWEELKQLKDYHIYTKYLDPIEDLIKNDYTWDEKEDIKIAWYLPPYHKKFIR